MSVVLSGHLPLLATAPDGIQKLRGLILELAVRGKLVPQDPSDEPASELLKRISKEKARLEAEGVCKKSKPVPPVGEDEQPFASPNGWKWLRVADMGETQTGTTPSKTQANFFGSDVPFIKPGDISELGINYENEGLSVEGAANSGRLAAAGSVLMVCIGTIGKCGAIDRNCSFNQQINSVTPLAGTAPFILTTMRSNYFQMEAWHRSSSTTIAILNKGNWESIPVPLPPLAEQHRIVAKVDELMKLCDRLEAEQTDAASSHTKLVETLLGTLTQSRDADELAANWQRLSQHFDTLFSTETSLDALKQTILQLAVMGKLVSQDPSDEPASELLKVIAKERARLEAKGDRKKSSPVSPVGENEQPFVLPVGWLWTTVEMISFVGTGTTPSRTNTLYYDPPLIPWVTSGETRAPFIGVTAEKVSPLALKETNLTVYPVGTLIVAMYGQGKTRGQISELQIEAATNQACSAIIPVLSDSSFRKYIKLFFEKIYDEIREVAAGGAQPNLNVGKIKATLVSLPPLAEQHRIVTKVNELMALCDHLKTDLAESRVRQARLSATLIDAALQAA